MKVPKEGSPAFPSPATTAKAAKVTGDTEIRCTCGSNANADNDFSGLTIACDVCGRWCHAACVGVSAEDIPEDWACWVCEEEQQEQQTPVGPSNWQDGKAGESVEHGERGVIVSPEQY